jgi:hypothetical protein
MLYREIIAVYSEIHTKHKLIHCVGRTWNLWMLNLVVHIVTTGLWRIKNILFQFFDWESVFEERKEWLNYSSALAVSAQNT